MAFRNFMNMEKLSLTIAEEHLLQMTDDNFIDDPFLNADKLINNLKNGFVIITQLSCYFESFLNTIIASCINYEGECLLRCSRQEKLDIIFMHYQKDLSMIKRLNSWSVINKVTKVRNAMIHYKKTYIGDGSFLPDFKLGGELVGQFFTKNNMDILFTEHIKFANEIAAILGLKTFHDISIFECDGRDGLVNYVYNVDEVYVDESRFT